MESPSGGSPPKRPLRPGSSGRALPRRSTRGPLDPDESPIPIPTTNAQPNLPAQSSSLSNNSYITAPRTLSPQPSSLTYRSAQSTLSPTHSDLASQPEKDFSSLLRPELYHPLTLLDVPAPLRAASSQPDPSTPLDVLMALGHFRSAAIKAAQLLTNPPSPPSAPYTSDEILRLFYSRLSALTLCNSTALASQEVKALEDLNSAHYRNQETGEHICPWELRVLAVRLQGMGYADARRGVIGYYDLVRDARTKLTVLKKSRRDGMGARRDLISIDDEILKWENRLAELGIRVASALIEMGDFAGATRFLSTLKPSSFPGLETQKGLLWLCLGDIEAARQCISSNDGEKSVITALAHMGDADFSSAATEWEHLIEFSPTRSSPELPLYKQNLGVCLLYLGRMSEAKTILEELVDNGDSFHALTFNLSTIYELCTERSRAMKVGLAEKVATVLEEEREAGGGSGKIGWEKVNADFKL